MKENCEQISSSAKTQLYFVDTTYEHVTQVPPSNRKSVISGGNAKLTVNWDHAYEDTLKISGLRIVLSEGGIFYDGMAVLEPNQLAHGAYNLDWDLSRGIGWREESGAEKFYTSIQLTDSWIRRLLDHLRDQAVGKTGS